MKVQTLDSILRDLCLSGWAAMSFSGFGYSTHVKAEEFHELSTQ